MLIRQTYRNFSLQDQISSQQQRKFWLQYNLQLIFKEVAAKFDEQAQTSAKKFSYTAKGKRIRNADKALAAFNKYKGNINKKFSQKDREAIANAIAGLKQAELAKKLKICTRAPGFISYGLNILDIIPVSVTSIKTGDYKAFYLKVETFLVGYYATEAVALVFSIITGSALGILGFALLMAMFGTLIDDSLVREINDTIFN